MELCKVKNIDNKPLLLRHDVHGDVRIDPRKERIVSLDHIVVNFGNPGARNEGKHKVRDAEYAAIRTRWGFYPGIQPEAEWEEMRPKFEVYDLDDQRVYTVLEDPRGEMTSAGTQFVLTDGDRDNALLNKRIESLEAQLAQAVALLGQLTATPAQVPQTPAVGHSEGTAATADPEQVAAAQETQEDRNEQRDELPTPKPAGNRKDKPATTRVGSK